MTDNKHIQYFLYSIFIKGNMSSEYYQYDQAKSKTSQAIWKGEANTAALSSVMNLYSI